MKLIRLLLLIAIAGAPVSPLLAEQVTSDVLLAQVYQRGIDVRKFLVSEKFDGVRAVWDGKIFHTRSGRVIAAPAWFIKVFLQRRSMVSYGLHAASLRRFQVRCEKTYPSMKNGAAFRT